MKIGPSAFEGRIALVSAATGVGIGQTVARRLGGAAGVVTGESLNVAGSATMRSCPPASTRGHP